jgi:hypothetical protein
MRKFVNDVLGDRWVEGQFIIWIVGGQGNSFWGSMLPGQFILGQFFCGAQVPGQFFLGIGGGRAIHFGVSWIDPQFYWEMVRVPLNPETSK